MPFVLIIGGPNANGYSIGYATQICLGIVVGLAVNLLILPPLAIGQARERLAGFHRTLTRHLTEVVSGMVWGKPIALELPPELRPVLSEALHAVAAAITAGDDDERHPDHLD